VLLYRYVDGLLALAAPRLTYRPERTRSAVLTTNGLFGALVLQLLLRLHGSTGFAICSGCGQIYTPWRRPAADSPAYCTDCRVADGNAVRQRRLRARLRLGAVGAGQRPVSPGGGSGQR
jgi:NAD-dependent SIR2 family protein deacetylase